MRQNRGNILFLILLAVVLFAALAYAVTSSMRGGGKDASNENVRAGASALAQYVTLLRNEVQRLMLINDCGPRNLDWRTGSGYKRYDNSNAQGYTLAPPSPKTGCAIFQQYGGAIAPQTFERYMDKAYDNYNLSTASTRIRAGHADFRWIGRLNELTQLDEVMIIIPGINPAICSYLMDPATSPAVPAEGVSLSTHANQTPTNSTSFSDIINLDANLRGEFMATLEPAGSVNYCFLYSVILPQ